MYLFAYNVGYLQLSKSIYFLVCFSFCVICLYCLVYFLIFCFLLWFIFKNCSNVVYIGLQVF